MQVLRRSTFASVGASITIRRWKSKRLQVLKCPASSVIEAWHMLEAAAFAGAGGLQRLQVLEVPALEGAGASSAYMWWRIRCFQVEHRAHAF